MIDFVNSLPGWGHGWTPKMTPSIPIFSNEINALEDFRGGAKVAHDFARHVVLGAARLRADHTYSGRAPSR